MVPRDTYAVVALLGILLPGCDSSLTTAQPDLASPPSPVRDEKGNIHVVMAEVDVDEKTLQAVANETGGQFYRATDTDSLQKIYEQINRYEKSAQTVQKFERVEDLYRWPLFPALGFLGIGVILQQTRFRRLP